MKTTAAGFTLFLFLSLFSLPETTAQCTLRGTVLSDPSANCTLLVTTPGGHLFALPENPYGLAVGDEILFGADASPEGDLCAPGVPVTLNCLQVLEGGNGMPCAADFSVMPLSAGSLTRVFYPGLSAEGVYSYSWDMGDGTVSTAAHPMYTYPEEGTYEVCLTLTAPNGCMSTLCESVEVIADVAGSCGVLVDVSGNGETFSAAAYNLTAPGGSFVSLQWTAFPGGMDLGQEIGFGFSAPAGEMMEEICLSYTLQQPDGNNCSGEVCRSLLPDDVCLNPDLVDPQVDCPTQEEPVCGCDGVTYASSCEATFDNGVTSFTPGPCPTGTNFPGDCQAYFSFEKTDDFVGHAWNISTGLYTEQFWELNGAVLGYEDAVDLYDLQAGIYNLCLTIGANSGSCTSTYCRQIFMGSDEDLCQFTDCVWPGDANGNGQANMYDVLEMALGYGMVGSYRPDATIQWQGQLGPDWNMNTVVGVDYKHLDADGSGQVTETDLYAIDLNYQPPLTGGNDPVAGAPVLYIDFHQDTIVFGPDSPEEVSISADILLGTPANPAVNVYGLAFSLIYPQQDVILPHSASFSPVTSGFLGLPGELVSFEQDLYNLKRLDAAVSRKDGNNRSGYSVVGQADFIVVSDIIGGRSEDVIEFALTVDNARMLNADGEPLEYDLPAQTAVLYIINEMTTATTEPELNDQWTLFPNPASGTVTLNSGTLGVEMLTVQTVSGVRVYQSNLDAGLLQIPVSDWAPGVYLVEVMTREGRSVKKLVVSD